MSEPRTSQKIQTSKTPVDPLPDMPLDPAQITEGNPVARGTVSHQSADKKVSSGFWSCSEGQFDWTFTWDEFVRIIEGEVTITEEGGDTYDLGPNDTAHFPCGLKAHWHVKKAVRKFFVIRTPEPFEL